MYTRDGMPERVEEMKGERRGGGGREDIVIAAFSIFKIKKPYAVDNGPPRQPSGFRLV